MNGEAMAAFMEGFQRTKALMDQQRLQRDELSMRREDRQQVLTRQSEQDRIAAEQRQRAEAIQMEDRQRRIGMERLQVPSMLAELGGGASDPSEAQRLIESMMPSVLQAFGPEALALGQPAVEMARQTITARQKKDVERFVDQALQTSFVADNPEADPVITNLPDHIQRVIGKPEAKLSELQTFAQLPVGKPPGKTRVPAAAGSFEEYSDPATPADRKAQIEADRKAYMQSDDRAPRVTVNTGGLNPYQDAQFTERLAKTWNDANTSSREMRRSLGLMETGLRRFREGDKNGGSQAVLVTFQKILDPTSVVRESEYARSAAGISMLARMEGYMERLKSGGAGVPDAELTAMVETARQMLAGMQGYSQTQRSRIEAQAKKHKIDPVLIFGVEEPDAPVGTPPPAARPAGPRKNPFRPQ